MALELVDYKCKRKPSGGVRIGVKECILGRHQENAVCLMSVAISRKHASITKSEEGYYQLHDLKAVNRVYLNDVVLSAGATEVLKSGDEIRLGIKSELAEAEYFTYKFIDGVQIGSTKGNKRKTSLSPDHCAKQPRCTPPPSLRNDGNPRCSSTDAAETEELRRKAELAAVEAAKARLEAEAERVAAEAKAEAEKAALAQELTELRRLQDEQKASIAANEEALRQEMADLQSKHETEVAEALRGKEREMENSIKSIQNEQSKKEEEMKTKLEERDKELHAAKDHEKKMEALEAELKSTREEQERLSKVSAQVAVQEKISDLLEDQLQCTICSELMIKPKNFPCSHTFCGFCIDRWLEKKKECPVCRSRVTVATQNYLICSLIDKAVEEMSEENKNYRKSVVAAREVEIEELNAKKNPGKGKKGKNRRQPTNNNTANRNNPSSSNAARPTTTQHTTSTTNTPGTQASGSSLNNYQIPRIPYSNTPPITHWFNGSPQTSASHPGNQPGTSRMSNQPPNRATSHINNAINNMSSHQQRNTQYSAAPRYTSGRNSPQQIQQLQGLIRGPNRSQYTGPSLPSMSNTSTMPRIPTPGARTPAGTPHISRAANPNQPRCRLPVNHAPLMRPLAPSNLQNSNHLSYQAMVNQTMYRFTLPAGSSFPVALDTGNGDLFWVSPTGGNTPQGGAVMCKVTGTTKTGQPPPPPPPNRNTTR